MFGTFVNNLSRRSGNVRRSSRLEVETLEGRSLPSALGGAALPVADVSLAHTSGLGGSLDAGGASGAYVPLITRSSGEEIPQ